MKVLITAGLGDFVALEAWLPPEQKQRVKTILWATRSANSIRESIDLKLVFPNLKEQIILYDNWCSAEELTYDYVGTGGRPYCLANKWQLKDLNLPLSQKDIAEITDYSLLSIFDMITMNTRFYGSSYTKYKLADLPPGLPTKYVCIHPYSSNALAEHRDFTEKEWQAVIDFLNNHDLPGIVIGTGTGPVPVPSHSRLKSYIDETTVKEAIEITKNAEFFIGAASVFSVVATKALKESNTYIKGHQDLKKSSYLVQDKPKNWCLPLWKFYYSPFVVDKFLRQSLEQL